MMNLIDPQTGERYGLEVVACANDETLGLDADETLQWLTAVDEGLRKFFGEVAEERATQFHDWNGGKYYSAIGSKLFPRFFKMEEDTEWEDLDGEPMTYCPVRVHSIPETLHLQVRSLLNEVAISARHAVVESE